MRVTGIRAGGWTRSFFIIVMGLLTVWGVNRAGMQVFASDAAIDSDVVAVDDGSSDVLGMEESTVSSGQEAVLDDLSGLFVDTGEESITRKGDTLEEAQLEDDTLSGYGDGGSTINVGHLYVVNGVTVRNSDFPSEHNECWAYANNVYAKIWGCNFWSDFNGSDNMLRNLSDAELTLTPEHLKAYVSAAPAGAALRVCNSDYLHANDIGGHSQIIISHDANGFTVFEGGLSAFPHRREAYYTWTGYCYSGWPGRYQYIKYIKWPGAEPYSTGLVGTSAQDLGESKLDQYQDQVGKNFRELAAFVGDMILGKEDPKKARKYKKILIQAARDHRFDEDETENEAETEGETEPVLSGNSALIIQDA